MPPEQQPTPRAPMSAPPARDFGPLYTPVAIVLAGVLVGGGLYFGLSGKVAPAAGAPAPAAPAAGGAPAAAVNVKNVKISSEPYIGSANAPVTLAFWADYQCPFCKAFEVGGVQGISTPAAMPDLIAKYVDAGKLKIVFKDFPFLGKDSIAGAEYGRAVWRLYPDQYLAWRTAMYAAQDEEGDKGFGNAGTIDQLIKAKFPQMDDARIRVDIAANKSAYDAAMQADMQEGESYGINGTPGFITGTQLIDGAQPLSAFTAAIDAQLK